VEGHAVTSRRRGAIALVVGLAAAGYVLATPHMFPPYNSDFDQLHVAARAWWTGDNPYTVVGQLHARLGLTFGLLYPFPAVVAAGPVAWMPVEYARAMVAAVGAFGFAYLLLGRGWWLYPILLSASFRSSVSLVQVAPFLACAVMAPRGWWSFAAAVKPNVAAAAWATADDRVKALRFLIAPAVLAAVSLVLWPGWPLEWLEAVRVGGTANRPLVMVPGGWLLLLAAVAWRRPEARWLLAMALIPTNPKVYDALPLLVLLPRSHKGALVWALLSHVTELSAYAIAQRATDWDAHVSYHAAASLYGLYLPALAVILWSARTRDVVPA
jgi:hypothetical protein